MAIKILMAAENNIFVFMQTTRYFSHLGKSEVFLFSYCIAHGISIWLYSAPNLWWIQHSHFMEKHSLLEAKNGSFIKFATLNHTVANFLMQLRWMECVLVFLKKTVKASCSFKYSHFLAKHFQAKRIRFGS